MHLIGTEIFLLSSFNTNWQNVCEGIHIMVSNDMKWKKTLTDRV
jgi:hypothetical protein